MRGSSAVVPLVPLRDARVAGFELLARLGRGGAAEVFLARAGDGGLVVIKRLRDDAGDVAAAEDALLDEARLAERLVHPSIARTLGSGIDDGRRFLLLEHLAGQPFERLLDKPASEGERRALVGMLARALVGLHHAHEAVDEHGASLGVVHRDVSPHNLFVTYEGEVKVLDFGIALAASRSCATTTGLVKGKVAYMAPEQALSLPVDRRADVFSAGVVLAEAWSGRAFWAGASDVQILRAHSLGERPDARALVGDEGLAAIVARATEPTPEARYASARELADALEAWLEPGREAWLEGRSGEPLERRERATFARLMRGWFGDEERALAALIDGASAHAPAEPPSIGGGDVPEHASPVAETTLSNLAVARSSKGGGRRERRGAAWAALGLLAALAGVALSRLGASVPASGDSTPEAEPAASAVAVVDVGHVRMTLQVFPADATVELDGALVPTNPFTARVPKDGVARRLHAEAPGFEPVDRLLVLDADDTISIRLEPSAQPSVGREVEPKPHVGAEPPAKRPRPLGPSEPHPASATTAAHTPRREGAPLPTPKLDTRDPWAP